MSFYDTEKGTENIKLSTLKKLSKALNVSLDYLTDDNSTQKEITASCYDIKTYQFVIDLYNSLTNENKMNAISYMRALTLLNKPSKPKVQILGQTAAGKPLEYGDSYAQDIDDIEDVPKGADYALIVNGDSMEPDIKNGQTIYIKKTPIVENGTIAVVEVDGAVTCKKVYIWNNHIELQSINKAYEPMIIKGGDFRILGKVILNRRG
jgi:SOS-response transcriptional repressor LexA